MRIKMVGIDHSKASLLYREAFSFTKAGVKEAIKEIKERYEVKGCLLLSTCNRTELWISQCKDEKLNMVSPYRMLCEIKKISTNEYEEYFTEREDNDAIEHLLEVVCGFDSKIFGEDQIISQVREALLVSRECSCADASLEKVFQMALAAGKRVKTEVHMSSVSRSSANDMVRILKERMGSLIDVKCMVIGNGQMGKLVANLMVAHGAQVSMTLRRRLHGSDEQQSIMPEGCRMIPYDERLSEIAEHEVIVSATLSPHYTMKLEEVEESLSTQLNRNKTFFFFDLAVPRDIDPQLATLPNVQLFDIDSMNSGGAREENQEQIKIAKRILSEYKEELARWFEFRNHVPKIKEIVELVSEDTAKRFVGKTAEDSNSMETTDAVEDSARRATAKMLYGLREQLSPKLWEECLEALYKSAARETLKH